MAPKVRDKLGRLFQQARPHVVVDTVSLRMRMHAVPLNVRSQMASCHCGGTPCCVFSF